MMAKLIKVPAPGPDPMELTPNNISVHWYVLRDSDWADDEEILWPIPKSKAPKSLQVMGAPLPTPAPRAPAKWPPDVLKCLNEDGRDNCAQCEKLLASWCGGKYCEDCE